MGFKILTSQFGALDVLGVLSIAHYGGDTASLTFKNSSVVNY